MYYHSKCCIPSSTVKGWGVVPDLGKEPKRERKVNIDRHVSLFHVQVASDFLLSQFYVYFPMLVLDFG